jgi:hypothetical protein
MPYPHRNAELLATLAAVCLFAGVWFPVIRAVRGWGWWIEVPAAALPLLLLVGTCAALWRRWHRE